MYQNPIDHSTCLGPAGDVHRRTAVSRLQTRKKPTKKAGLPRPLLHLIDGSAMDYLP